MAGRPQLRFFLDNCVPDSVGRVLEAAGHTVIYQRDVIAVDSPDRVVALAAAKNDAILISIDKDHKAIASRFHVSNKQLRKLSRIDLRCSEPEAARRIELALDFIVFEWERAGRASDQRMFLEIQGNAFKTVR
jgi:predicted nuclease of predicted toxin-antitoxin system